MKTSDQSLSEELRNKLRCLLLSETQSNNLPAMRDRLQTLQDNIGALIQQYPSADAVLQDFIIDLETAEEALEDSIQGVNKLCGAADRNTSEPEPYNAHGFRYDQPVFGSSYQSKRGGE